LDKQEDLEQHKKKQRVDFSQKKKERSNLEKDVKLKKGKNL